MEVVHGFRRASNLRARGELESARERDVGQLLLVAALSLFLVGGP